MKKTALILSLLIFTSLIQGCSNLRAFGKEEDGCPAPSKDQLNKNGYLMLQNGITLKCQVKNYASRMSCQGITDKTGADGLICQSGNKQAAFVFDENGILKSHKFF